MRIYRVDEERGLSGLFLQHLLPVQRRYGAHLVGRRVTEQRDRVVTIWEYDTLDAYNEIAEAVRSDPDSLAARHILMSKMPPLYQDLEEVLMTSTVPIELTMLTSSTCPICSTESLSLCTTVAVKAKCPRSLVAT